MDELTTERLTLRTWQTDDADFVYDLYSRAEVQKYIGRVPRLMRDRSEALDRIAGWRTLDDPVLGVWAVQLSATGELLGTLLLKSIPASGTGTPPQPSGDIEIGWHFHPAAQGNGYATEAALAVLERAFAGGLTRVVAVTNPRNLASQAVCLRIGMTDLGPTDAYYDTTCELFAVSRP